MLKLVTLRQGLKPHGFFCLSSVRGMLSYAAWPRLGAYRNGGGKARDERIHSHISLPSRCQARCFSHASHKGMNGPQLAVGILGKSNTRLASRATLWECTHTGGGFPCAILREMRHFLNPWTEYPWLRAST